LTYADSGFVVSLYLTTEGTSAQARKEVKRASKPILLSPLSLLEIRNALNFGINRGEITSDQRDAVLAEIDAQIAKGFFRMVEASQSSIYAKAQELSNKHTPTIATRSLDLMHLAAALLSAARIFLTFDKRQAKAAAAEGLLVKPI
jgi:predicted nucleic acid-binding protein